LIWFSARSDSCGEAAALARLAEAHAAGRRVVNREAIMRQELRKATEGAEMSRASIYQDGTYLEKNPTWHQEDSPWKANQVAKMLRNNNIVPSTMCDIGCGAGGILKCLANMYGGEVVLVGYDVSPQAIELCRKNEQRNLSYFAKDPFDEGDVKFDVVLSMDVFEHVEDYVGFLRKVKKKGTYKIFHIPLDLSVQSVLRSSQLLKGRRLAGHIHYFTKETALATLQDAGYELMDYVYTRGSIDLPKNSWKINLMKLPLAYPVV
jgi:SAM-dependent methyltransferase